MTTHDLRNIKYVSNDSVLLINIQADFPGIKEDDEVILKIGNEDILYSVHSIKYEDEKNFKANLIFVNYCR